ncbi:hypothetical protein [Paenibacillus sp. MSJ-34]|uniref:hypothetical protein n=1 Tax=Paenibacillus sp. MSJ-34 TaxID=2841529 RepID=UPI001C0F8CFA|nr:hypothetical protein [Paenibacillus sp. MSJ-34]MBU5441354.1 hypothetical protein [Paenibacillus sp. MSJ-34]
MDGSRCSAIHCGTIAVPIFLPISLSLSPSVDIPFFQTSVRIPLIQILLPTSFFQTFCRNPSCSEARFISRGKRYMPKIHFLQGRLQIRTEKGFILFKKIKMILEIGTYVW